MYIIFKVYVVFHLKFKSYSVKPMIEKKNELVRTMILTVSTRRVPSVDRGWFLLLSTWSQLYRFRRPCCSFNLYWLYGFLRWWTVVVIFHHSWYIYQIFFEQIDSIANVYHCYYLKAFLQQQLLLFNQQALY